MDSLHNMQTAIQRSKFRVIACKANAGFDEVRRLLKFVYRGDRIGDCNFSVRGRPELGAVDIFTALIRA